MHFGNTCGKRDSKKEQITSKFKTELVLVYCSIRKQ